MYKVFIDNKPIVFTEKQNKIAKHPDSVIVNLRDATQLDLVKCRNELPEYAVLVVIATQPEALIRKVFEAYDFVEAAGGIVKRKQKYLFIERHGLWDIPKGKMEKGESPAETAVREIEEECGIAGPVVNRLIGVTFHTYEFRGKPTLKKNWWYALDYSGPSATNPQTEEAISKVVWRSRKEWEDIRANTYLSIVEVLDLAGKW